MQEIPSEWVDRLFELMEEYFKEKWTDQFKNRSVETHKVVWQNGLIGLTKEEIKSGLFIARNMAKEDLHPPHVLDFFHYVKGTKKPPKSMLRADKYRNSELAKKTIQQMREIGGYSRA